MAYYPASGGGGGGGVSSVAAGDGTITIGGTAANPTVKVAKTLDSTYLTDFAAAVAATALLKANNLSDLANANTARGNLGLATIAASGSASDLTIGTVPTARLGAGAASASTYLRGDQSWQDFATAVAAAQATRRPGKLSGSFLWPPGAQQITAPNNLGQSVAGATPVIASVAFTADRIGADVGTAIASSVVELGYYDDDANGLPNNLLFTAGTIDGSTTGQKTITISQAIPLGLGFVAADTTGGASACTIRSLGNASTGIGNMVFQANDPSVTTTVSSCFVKTGQATLPTPFGTPTSLNRYAPVIYLRST